MHVDNILMNGKRHGIDDDDDDRAIVTRPTCLAVVVGLHVCPI